MSAIVFDSPCIRKGQPATTEIVVRYSDEWPGHLPLLVILGRWSVKLGTYRDHDVYDVEEIGSPLGRAFLLHRTKEAVAADPDGTERYGVLIANPQDCLCECKGFAAHGRCKHMAALSALLAAGHIDHPEAGRKPEPWPHPEQLADPWADDTVTLTDKGRKALDVTDPGYVLPSDLELIEQPY